MSVRGIIPHWLLAAKLCDKPIAFACVDGVSVANRNLEMFFADESGMDCSLWATLVLYFLDGREDDLFLVLGGDDTLKKSARYVMPSLEIYKTLNREGIEIPYSKHDIFIKELPGGDSSGAGDALTQGSGDALTQGSGDPLTQRNGDALTQRNGDPLTQRK